MKRWQVEYNINDGEYVGYLYIKGEQLEQKNDYTVVVDGSKLN